MTNTGDMIGTAIGVGFGILALNALSHASKNLEEGQEPRRERKRPVKREKDFWEDTFG